MKLDEIKENKGYKSTAVLWVWSYVASPLSSGGKGSEPFISFPVCCIYFSASYFLQNFPPKLYLNWPCSTIRPCFLFLTILWFSIVAGYRIIISFLCSSEADLRIGEVQWGDSGVYTCKVVISDDLEGQNEASVELLVLGKMWWFLTYWNPEVGFIPAGHPLFPDVWVFLSMCWWTADAHPWQSSLPRCIG